MYCKLTIELNAQCEKHFSGILLKRVMTFIIQRGSERQHGFLKREWLPPHPHLRGPGCLCPIRSYRSTDITDICLLTIVGCTAVF